MPPAKPDIHLVADAEELSKAAAEEFVRRVGEAVRARGVCTVALSGGSTPKSLYTLLAREGDASFRTQGPWDKIYFFWGDERHVPPTTPIATTTWCTRPCWHSCPSQQPTCTAFRQKTPMPAKRIVYLCAADNEDGPLPRRLRGLKQTMLSP